MIRLRGSYEDHQSHTLHKLDQNGRRSSSSSLLRLYELDMDAAAVWVHLALEFHLSFFNVQEKGGQATNNEF